MVDDLLVSILDVFLWSNFPLPPVLLLTSSCDAMSEHWMEEQVGLVELEYGDDAVLICIV